MRTPVDGVYESLVKDYASLRQAQEQFPIEQFVEKLPVEALRVAIWLRI
jgi:hypothetical protein